MAVKGLTVIHKELEDLASQYDWPQPKRALNMLQPRHIVAEFSGDNLFDDFARTVCESDCVPRKELFEAWAMALHVHDHFPESKRFADLASGHGLLSWALLLLNEERTAICVDIRMPKSAEKLRKVFVKKWPSLEDRWDFVEGKLEDIEPSPSTLMVGVHCCGILSDRVVGLSIKGNSPLALVPCCHTSKYLSKNQKSEIKEFNFNLSDYLDTRRQELLSEAGFAVVEGFIPEEFTPKNRIILAEPPEFSCNEEEKERDEIVHSVCWNPKGLPQFRIPVADTPKAQEFIRSISGQAAANLRKGHGRALSLSIVLPPEPITCEQLVAIANGLNKNVRAWVTNVDAEPFVSKQGHKYRTFSVSYRSKREDVLTKEEAKEIHVKLCHLIPEKFEGAWVRQIPVLKK
jgi:hypothetical protein